MEGNNKISAKQRNNRSNAARKKNDELLKGAFEDNFFDFLRFVNPEAEQILDFSKGVDFMNTELFAIIPDRERKKDKRIADLLAKLYLKNGTETWVLLNVEIEGSDDSDFAFRLLQYWYRIRDRFGVSTATIAVFTGEKNQKRPTEYKEELLGTVLSFKYTTYHVFDHTAETLLSMKNPFALIALACQKALLEKKIPNEELSEERLTIVRALLEQEYDHDRIITFLWFIKNFIFIDNEDINRIFDQQILALTEGAIDMGIIETIKMQERREGEQNGIEKGIKQGRHVEAIEIAREMKKDKFATEKIAKLTKLSIKEIESL